MTKSGVLIVVFAMVALAVGVYARHSLSTTTFGRTEVLPDFSFPDAVGREQSVRQWRGKILVINFWATWCPPCLSELPEFVKLQTEFQDLGVQFVGVAIDNSEAVNHYLRDSKVNYPILVAGDGGIALSNRLGNVVNAVPFTLVVDNSGFIVSHLPGELSGGRLREILWPLLDSKSVK